MTALMEREFAAAEVKPKKDNDVRIVAAAAAVLSVLAYVYYSYKGYILAYGDSYPHLDIARRVIDSPADNHLGQLGSVWLPLPHLLSLPLIGFDSLYYNGFAGSIISMLSYVIASVLVFKIAKDLTDRKAAGYAGAAVFMLCSAILYMQATPMTELLLIATMAGMVYGIQRWIRTDHYGYLIGGSLSGLAGCLTRYEAWALFLAMAIVIAVVVWRKGQLHERATVPPELQPERSRIPRRSDYARERLSGTLLVFSAMGGALAILFWFFWNLGLVGDPLAFIRSEFADSSLWVESGELALGNPWLAFVTYFFAMVNNIGWVVFALMFVGLVLMVAMERLALRTLPTLSLFSMFPFFIFMIADGHRPLRIEELGQVVYNIRFGLIMILPAAILVGYLVGQLRGFGETVVTASAAAVAVVSLIIAVIDTLNPISIAAVKDPLVVQNTDQRVASREASQFLREHYDGGLILMETFGNEFVLHDARISPGNNVSESSYGLWDPAVDAPRENDIQWIVMREDVPLLAPDKVFHALDGTEYLEDNYEEVFDNGIYKIYEEQ